MPHPLRGLQQEAANEMGSRIRVMATSTATRMMCIYQTVSKTSWVLIYLGVLWNT